MVYIEFRFKVADYERWMAEFKAAALWRMQAGEQHARIFRDADDPMMLTVIQGWTEDMGTAQLYVQSDDLRRLWQNAGVIGAPSVFLLQEVTP